MKQQNKYPMNWYLAYHHGKKPKLPQITITNKQAHRWGKQSFYYAKTLAPDNPEGAGGMLSLTRSLKNELLDTKYSIKKAYLLQAICYGNPCILIKPFNEYVKTLDKKHDQYSTKEEEEEEEEEEEDEEECEEMDAESAPKSACYSLKKVKQEKARNTQRKYSNKMTTSKPNTISFQVNNFVKIKINKVDKTPLHPNTLLGKLKIENCNQIGNY